MYFTESHSQEWTDEKLRWNPEDYGDLKIIRTSAESIWKPDLLLYNNAKTSNIDHFGLTDVLIYNDGKILWVPPTDFHTFCRLNLRLWPFDQQTCHVKLGSWVHDASSLNLTLNTKPGVDTTDDESEVWTIQNITVKHNTVTYECCPEPYVDVEYFFTVKRTSSCYVVVVSPIILNLLLTLSVFWLPPHCPEKIVLNGIVMMIATALLIYFSIQLPIRYGNAPLVGKSQTHNKKKTENPNIPSHFSDLHHYHVVPDRLRSNPLRDRNQNLSNQAHPTGSTTAQKSATGRPFRIDAGVGMHFTAAVRG